MISIRRIAVAAVFISAAAFGAANAAEKSVLMTFKSLTPEAALELAQATLKACRAGNYQITVAVVDRGGVPQVLLRDRFAGPHTPDTATRKAWTAVSFRTNTSELATLTQPGQPQSAARDVRGALMLGGGIMVQAGGSLVGAIGVSGAPGGKLDEDCANAGIEAIQELIEF